MITLSPPEPLTAQHDVSSFNCGKSALDGWLKRRALINQEKGFTAVMVIHEAMHVIGFYGIVPTSVILTILPRSIRTGQPPCPVPCLLLGQLAVDQTQKGRGLGAALLSHALQRCVTGAHLVGGRALIIHAVDDEAVTFWLKQGFLQSKDSPLVLFRSISDIEASLVASQRTSEQNS